jgi:Replication-relaxation
MTRPIAQPVAQISRPGMSRSGPGFPEIRTRKDSVPLRPSRISARQLDRIACDLTDLDRDVLSFASAYRLATGKQLVRRFWVGEDDERDRQARVGRRALKRLADWQVLDPLPGRARGGVRGGSDTLIYSVGLAGVRLRARQGLTQKRLGTPSDRHIAHTLTTAEAAVRLFEADRAGAVECIEIQAEPECWRPFLGAMGARLILKPDLYLRVAVPGSAYEYRWLCEVDMATEHKGTLLAKCQRYLAHYRSGTEQHEHGVYPKVLWLVPDERRAAQIEEILGRLPIEARRLFTVCEFDDAAQFLAAEARS